MSRKMTGTQELLILLGAVIVWPVLWALMTGGPIWTDYPWGLVAFLYLAPIKRGLLTGIIYLAWLIGIMVFKNGLTMPSFIILAILAGFMTGASALIGSHVVNKNQQKKAS
ncbi:hypothetical protein [Weissella cibaria]|uniref:hypothetical protein n=1 Tax=Weissella cibaria TaxID=137591 RepID=UPI00215A1948|nr:hypothetical protein [Weissella cibaria]MCR8702119.1 hypothetical protein [Weissella cibaria]